MKMKLGYHSHRPELRVVLEEESGGGLRRLGGLQLVRVILLGLLRRGPVVVLGGEANVISEFRFMSKVWQF